MTTQNGDPTVSDHDVTERLARRYRTLLRAYPRSYREQRGEEIIGTLLDTAPPGRSRPSLADATDLIAAGVRHRLGLDAVPALHRGLVLAGPLALGFAAGLALVYWLVAEPDRYAMIAVIRDPLAPFPMPYDLAPYCYAAWLVAFGARLLLPRAAHRALIGLAILVLPVAWTAAAVSLPVQTPPEPAGLLLLALGVVAFAGCGEPAHPAERLRASVVAAGAAGVTVLPHLLHPGSWPATRITEGAALAGAVLLLVLTGYGLRRAVTARDHSWLWATGALFVAVGWSSVLNLAVPWSFGYSPMVALSSLAGFAALVWLAVRHRAGVDRVTARGVGIAGSAALGFGAAVAVTLLVLDAAPYPSVAPSGFWRVGEFDTVNLVAYGAWLVAAAGWLVTNRPVPRLALLGTAVAGTVAVPLLDNQATDPGTVALLFLLGLVGLLAYRTPLRSTRHLVACGFAVAGIALVVQFGIPTPTPHPAYVAAFLGDDSVSAVRVVLLTERGDGVLTWNWSPVSPAVAGLPALVFAAVVAGYWVLRRVDDRLRRHYTAGAG